MSSQADFQDFRDVQLVKRAVIDAASGGYNTVVAAVGGERVRGRGLAMGMAGAAGGVAGAWPGAWPGFSGLA